MCVLRLPGGGPWFDVGSDDEGGTEQAPSSAVAIAMSVMRSGLFMLALRHRIQMPTIQFPNNNMSKPPKSKAVMTAPMTKKQRGQNLRVSFIRGI
jgi:hypothetical protein